MNGEKDIIIQLQEKITLLSNRVESFKNEIDGLRQDINALESKESEYVTTKTSGETDQEVFIQELKPEVFIQEPQSEVFTQEPKPEKHILPAENPTLQPILPYYKDEKEQNGDADRRKNIEKFIGENLINKIGIGITIIGVGIGAKYAIDNQLISPLTRIILGYLIGLVLFAFSIHLKKQYENFSAVLLSGSMAIFYFITFAAFSFYALYTQLFTFALMVLFTVFTVMAAIKYNKQVIAHIGLVGAYAVPFLLSDGSGKIAILLSYVAIINVGILVIAFRKYWKPLYYSSFVLTWLIFLAWFIPDYDPAIHLGLSSAFVSIYFITFYIIFLAYKLRKQEKFELEDILQLLVNSFIFYGTGYSILNQHIIGCDFLGLFTLCNVFIHSIVSVLLYRQKQSDRNLFSFILGLAVVFLTISIPVQLDGNWVTLFWSAEAALLFWIGRTKSAPVYEWLSYPLMILAFFSLSFGWPDAYHISQPTQNGAPLTPLFNINFLTSMVFVVSFAFINSLNSKKQYVSPLEKHEYFSKAANLIIPAMLLIGVYFTFYLEIANFWNQLYASTLVPLNAGLAGHKEIGNENIFQYKTIFLIIYSMLFFSVLSQVNILKIKNNFLGLINLGLSTFTLGLFLTLGLFALGTLRDNYLSQLNSVYFYRGFLDIGIRYLSFAFVGLLLFIVKRQVKQEFLLTDLHKEFDYLLHISLLTLAGNELINLMDLFSQGQSYKLGLSILFGSYALLLIVLGIWKKKFHLRVGAIVLFSATLVKLFFYDLTYLNTISKTIIFLVLGLLLLVISFLYNKYKKVIFDDGGQ